MITRFALLCALFVPRLLDAASCCEQTYTVLGIVDHGDSRLWFHESWDAECLTNVLWQVALEGDSVGVVHSQYMELWDAESRLSQIKHKKPQVLDYSNGVYSLGDTITVTSPRYDVRFEGMFRRLARETADASGPGWRRFCQNECLDDPLIDPAELELLYEHPTGIYKNYLVYDAVYFASRQLLVVVTYQPTRGDGHDTMHGLLIYRLIPQFDWETAEDNTDEE